eukprot:438128-Hanusia_phi.AAC.2
MPALLISIALFAIVGYLYITHVYNELQVMRSILEDQRVLIEQNERNMIKHDLLIDELTKCVHGIRQETTILGQKIEDLRMELCCHYHRHLDNHRHPPLLFAREPGGVGRDLVLEGHRGGHARGGVLGSAGVLLTAGDLGDEERLRAPFLQPEEDAELGLEVFIVELVVSGEAVGHEVGDLLDVDLRVLQVGHDGVDIVDLLVEPEGLHGGGGLLDGGDEGLVHLVVVEELEVVLEGLALLDDLGELDALLLGLDEEGLEGLDPRRALGLDLLGNGPELAGEALLLRLEMAYADDEAVDGMGRDRVLVLVHARAAQGADPSRGDDLDAGRHAAVRCPAGVLCGVACAGGIYKSRAGEG